MHWIAWEWLHMKNSFFYKVLRLLLLPTLAILSKNSDVVSDKLATAFRVIAKSHK
jgi:hypothetical protein